MLQVLCDMGSNSDVVSELSSIKLSPWSSPQGDGWSNSVRNGCPRSSAWSATFKFAPNKRSQWAGHEHRASISQWQLIGTHLFSIQSFLFFTCWIKKQCKKPVGPTSPWIEYSQSSIVPLIMCLNSNKVVFYIFFKGMEESDRSSQPSRSSQRFSIKFRLCYPNSLSRQVSV